MGVFWLSPPVMSAPPLLSLSPRSSRVMPRLLTLLPSFREISVILLERKVVLKVWLIYAQGHARACRCAGREGWRVLLHPVPQRSLLLDHHSSQTSRLKRPT